MLLFAALLSACCCAGLTHIHHRLLHAACPGWLIVEIQREQWAMLSCLDRQEDHLWRVLARGRRSEGYSAHHYGPPTQRWYGRRPHPGSSSDRIPAERWDPVQ